MSSEQTAGAWERVASERVSGDESQGEGAVAWGRSLTAWLLDLLDSGVQ